MDQDTLPLTHEFPSETLGVQRSTLSAVLRSLQTSGLIVRQRGGIVVTTCRLSSGRHANAPAGSATISRSSCPALTPLLTASG
nr:helix-turn-helix domain-containing protein [Microvirga makkahensis]